MRPSLVTVVRLLLLLSNTKDDNRRLECKNKSVQMHLSFRPSPAPYDSVGTIVRLPASSLLDESSRGRGGKDAGGALIVRWTLN